MAGSTFPVYPGWNTVRRIGSGSYGAVYEIERDLMGRKEKAALKVITIPKNDSDVEELYNNGMDTDSVTAYFNEMLSDIIQEYQFMTEIKGHTNIVYCDDIRYIQKDDGIGWNIYIRMELLTPLVKTIDGPISEEQVVKMGMDICQALIVCRNRKILHRDIKPQNILVSQDGDYKLGDFGIAKTAERTSGGTKIGTYDYMAPEVFHYQPYGHCADIYSLGLVMYWMLNERRIPFSPLPPKEPTAKEMDMAKSRRFAGETLPEPLHGSAALKKIVLKACAYEVNKRYSCAEDLLRELESLKSSDEETIIDPPEPPLVPRPFRTQWMRRILYVCTLLLAVGMLVMAFRRYAVPPLSGSYHPSEKTTSDSSSGSWRSDTLSYTLSEERLTVSGTGGLTYTGDVIPNWELIRLSVQELVIEDGITAIGYNAFYGCQSLKSVKIPSTVTDIGIGAFGNCLSLTEIQIPDSVTTIQARTFSGCEELASISLPSALTLIDWLAFSECDNLQQIVIPDKTESIGAYSFSKCSSLENVQLPASLIRIGMDAFSGCTKMYKIVYLGTAAQWEQIETEKKALPKNAIIVCSDKTISSNQNAS